MMNTHDVCSPLPSGADAKGASVATAARSISAACDEGRFIFPEERALTPLDLSSQRSVACDSDGRWIHISYVPSDLRCQVIG